MITWINDKELGASIRSKSVTVLLRKEDESGVVEYRSAEVLVPNDAPDTKSWIAANVTNDVLWESGSAAVEGDFMAAYQRKYRKYHYRILQAVQRTMAAGGSLDTIIAAALEAIGSVTAKKGEFDLWRSLLGISAAEVTDTKSKRDLLMAILAFANSGIIAGDL